jgi:hypothetical protein
MFTPTRAAFARPGPGVTPFPDVVAPMQPSDSLPPSATALVPLTGGLPRCGRLFYATWADNTCARNVSCVGDGSPALRETGMCRGEARASQVTGPSSSCVPWSNTPPDTLPSSPTSRRGRCGLRDNPALSASGKTIGFGAAVPRPARSHAYASPTPSLGSAPGLLPARAGSPLAGQVSHLLND